ncbi:hypothetical protein [uncultured Fibrella sp.]|uniref:hypothetical protein n=1 Tax=uncultured Fibrella sp. TaxID=1284596 RepID=UPI0035C97BB5
MSKLLEPISCNQVELRTGRGSKVKGGGPEGHYWHIYVNDKRAGNVYINIIDDERLGRHPSIHLFLNQQMRGKHIGRCVYKIACELSQYDAVYAHMRKSNDASKKAALEAGYSVLQNYNERQLTLIWRR